MVDAASPRRADGGLVDEDPIGRIDPEALARAHTLLARLVSRGPDPATGSAVRASPILAAALDEYPDAEPDAVAVDHEYAFGWAIQPFEGVFLDPVPGVGGPSAEGVRAAYGAMGFRPDPRGEEPEHLATELRALAFLAGAEADAEEDGVPEVAARVRGLARAFLDGHLLRWAPLLCASLCRTGRAWPVALGRQIAELLTLHRLSLGEPWPSPSAFPESAFDLTAPETGLADVATMLASPVEAGIYLSRHDVAHVGRGAGVPRGFGDRASMLHDLLRTALRVERFDEVIAALLGATASATGWAGDCHTVPPELDALTSVWRERSQVTALRLAQLRREHRRLSDTGPSRRWGE